MDATSVNDLKKRIFDLYKRMDLDGSKGLSHQEMFEGLKKMPFSPTIKLSVEEYNRITRNGEFCNKDGEMDAELFQMAMIEQMKLFAERQMALSIPVVYKHDENIALIMLGLKLVLSESQKSKNQYLSPSSAAAAAMQIRENPSLMSSPREKLSARDRIMSESYIYSNNGGGGGGGGGGGDSRIVDLLLNIRQDIANLGERVARVEKRLQEEEDQSQKGSAILNFVHAMPENGQGGSRGSGRRRSLGGGQAGNIVKQEVASSSASIISLQTATPMRDADLLFVRGTARKDTSVGQLTNPD
eukprot:745786-Hanusia_phi.AAC.1